MAKALIFDFDGTILDTETPWYEAFRELYAEHNVELTLEQYSQCIGTSLHLFNPYEYLITDCGITIDRDAFRARVHEKHAELMRNELVRPGVVSFLDSAKAAGLRIGLASSSKLDWVTRHLDRLGLASYFECIRTADHVTHVKPDPSLYLQAISELGIEAADAIAIEDSPNGAKAALAAGLHCVVLPNKITKLLDFGTITKHGQSLEDISFEHLIRDPSGFLARAAV
ncbi:HAD family hydrolase [Paenibacillus glycanilyticus]|uniref:Haloacid dehalogenase n=1 Tax=Paenibacillus glycanilyticus TaxID=126569 RepID=A0ABQ6GBW7_9BACL|nr:HAD-IA family hydrolase [Paenibacillus glycanilyticus]GLX66806.1 haloacid dehalogenase [Paenibacillus glycanilyticus]